MSWTIIRLTLIHPPPNRKRRLVQHSLDFIIPAQHAHNAHRHILSSFVVYLPHLFIYKYMCVALVTQDLYLLPDDHLLLLLPLVVETVYLDATFLMSNTFHMLFFF